MPREVTLVTALAPIRASTPAWKSHLGGWGSVPFLFAVILENHAVVKEATRGNVLSSTKTGTKMPESPQPGQLFGKPVKKPVLLGRP